MAAEDGGPWAVSMGWRRLVTYLESSQENVNLLQGNLAQLQSGYSTQDWFTEWLPGNLKIDSTKGIPHFPHWEPTNAAVAVTTV
jgi:hypothetical protein